MIFSTFTWIFILLVLSVIACIKEPEYPKCYEEDISFKFYCKNMNCKYKDSCVAYKNYINDC